MIRTFALTSTIPASTKYGLSDVITQYGQAIILGKCPVRAVVVVIPGDARPGGIERLSTEALIGKNVADGIFASSDKISKARVEVHFAGVKINLYSRLFCGCGEGGRF
jgi:hypothetical protein